LGVLAPPHPTFDSLPIHQTAANGIVATQSGVLHGTRRQVAGAAVNGCASYLLGLPLMLLLAFRLGQGVQGLWWGIGASSALQAGVLLAVVSRLDWQAEAQRAVRLVRHLSKPHLAAAAAAEAGLDAAGEEVLPPTLRGV
jgi:MATE family multidrug resistance protein